MPLPNALLSNPEAAAVALARYLSEGSLALLLGAGVSKGVGLPNWYELVKKCLVDVGLKAEAGALRKNCSIEILLNAIDKVERTAGSGKAYREIVKKNLYDSIDEFSDTIITEKLLIALGALLMGSKRGRVGSVINFNFDDALEWYLRLHGFQVQVISKLPVLARDVDVTVYHPHGFLPKMMPESYSSDFLVFSQYSYDEKLGASRDLWMELTKHTLRERVGLFVGLSGKDPTFDPMLVDVQKSISSNSARPTGFILFGPEDVDAAHFEQRNVVPVRFSSFKDIPTFLLRVCQLAASL